MTKFESSSLPLESIIVDRDIRQRRKIEVTDLVISLRQNGLINPIVVDREAKLIAGERRLTAAKELGWQEIDVRYADTLDPIELQILELEENIKREELDWQDQVDATARIHQLYLARDPEWTMGETAAALGQSLSLISIRLRLNTEIEKGNEKVLEARGQNQAYNLLMRKDSRAAARDLEDLLDATPQAGQPIGYTLLDNAFEDAATQSTALTYTTTDSAGEIEVRRVPIEAVLREPEPEIVCQSFLDWAPSYRGDKFNLIHCDFPYGIDFASGPQGGKGQDGVYDDSRDVFFTLLETFCRELDNFASLSSHFVFWFSMKHWDPMRAMLRNMAPSIEWFPHPLIWTKSDNAGVAPDIRRHPRHTYETALFGWRGSRQIIETRGDFYSAPTDRALHPSAKPEPMLKHFFSMLVDEHTRLLDPTCGAGSSLRAADALGASAVFGMDIDAEHVSAARTALSNSRKLRNASKVMA